MMSLLVPSEILPGRILDGTDSEKLASFSGTRETQLCAVKYCPEFLKKKKKKKTHELKSSQTETILIIENGLVSL